MEAAWGKVAQDIGQDPEYVVSATHGKRAVDNLSHFKPHIKEHEMDSEVTKFEESILFFADAHKLHGPGSKFGDHKRSSNDSKRFSFGHRLLNLLNFSSEDVHIQKLSHLDDDFVREFNIDSVAKIDGEGLEAWQLEAASVDRAIQILPGVKRIIDSIPAGRYAVATSGAKTYGIFSPYLIFPQHITFFLLFEAYGCMSRVGISPPAVTITADDKRLKAGKPAPDPFLLAADCLGYDPKKCVVFEDSPSGIRSGVASGATVIAVCTSHDRSKIENCGAHYVVENMDYVSCEVEGDRLKFSIVA